MSHTTNPNVQYVTSFYKVDSFASTEQLFENFRPFLHAKFKILIFTDDKDFPSEFGEHANMRAVYLPRTSLQSFQFESSPELPANRNKEKDSQDFLSLMNAKPELLLLASKLIQADAYVWFDLGILKVSKFHGRFVERMNRFSESIALHPNKLLFPACYGRDRIPFGNMFSSPIWRFCGGILIVPSSLVSEFYELHRAELSKCKASNKLTWEVNLFAACEQANPDLFVGYQADHNDTIVNAPLPVQAKIHDARVQVQRATNHVARLPVLTKGLAAVVPQ